MAEDKSDQESDADAHWTNDATEPAPSPEPSALLDAPLTDRLEHVIDDTEGREEAVELTIRKLLEGTSFEQAAADLIADGWAIESADAIVEEAREATKRERGVRTREDVVISASRKFGKTIRRVRWIIIIGIVIVAIAIGMILKQGE